MVTGQLFGTMQALNPRWWLPDVLNRALKAERYRRQVYRNLRIELWQKQPFYPRHHLHWDEGQTEVDVVITWENPPTTVFIEMKYGSALSPTTANNAGTNGYPSDQLIRNARVGLWQNGWFSEERLIQVRPRDFVLLLVSPSPGNPLVNEYRRPDRLRAAIPYGDRLVQLPRSPFIGELSYRMLIDVLREQYRWFTRSERVLIDQLSDYLRFKLAHRRTFNGDGHK